MDTRKQPDQLEKSPKRFHRYFDYVRPEVTQRLKNVAAKVFNIWELATKKGHHAYDEMGVGSDIFLGIIPNTLLMQEVEAKANERGKSITIVSIVDVFEFTSGLDTVRPVDCQKHGWCHYHLPMTDYTPDMELDNILAAAKAVHEAKLRGDVVYIHCKAGKARSAMVLVVYFALYDADFRATLDQVTVNNPALLLSAAIAHIKKFRPQVDLHDELVDELSQGSSQHAHDVAWSRLLTEQETVKQEINDKYNGKKNIGKLCNALDTITLGMAQLQQQASPKVIDYSYHSEHFLNALVQSAPFKELIIFAWEIQKNALLEPLRQKYLDGFLTLLKNDPDAAIKDLKNGFMKRDPETCIGSLLINMKSQDIRDIIERLFTGVKHYDVYHAFDTTLLDKVALVFGDKKANEIGLLLANQSTVQCLASVNNHENSALFSDLFKLCKKIAPDLAPLIEQMQQNTLDLKWFLNLDKACEMYHFYKDNGVSAALRDAALERIGYPFGLLLAKAGENAQVVACISQIRNNGLAVLEQGSGLTTGALAKIADQMPGELQQSLNVLQVMTTPTSTATLSTASVTLFPNSSSASTTPHQAPPPRPSRPAPNKPGS